MIKLLENTNLAKFSSWRVGGPAERFVEPRTAEEVLLCLKLAEDNGWQVTVIGGGSNILISDKGISGLVVSTRKLLGIQEKEEDGKFQITAKAGTPKLLVMKSFLAKELAPSLFLSGIPGDIAGGVVMNAGVSEDVIPKEFCEIVRSFKVATSKGIREFFKDEIEWSYRHSSGWQPGVIVEVTLEWDLLPNPTMSQEVRAAQEVRSAKQPLDKPSCGSVFVNPDGGKAAQLIDSCGLKGFKIGGAEVSKKHANFIINSGGAKAQDIHEIIKHVQAVVLEKKSVELKNEVKYLGEWA